MRSYTFEWRNEEGNNCRMNCLTSDESQAWVWALRKCGWDQRTSLGIIGNNLGLGIRDGIIKNWWEAMYDNNLYNFNTLYLSWNLQDRLKSGFCKVVDC
jgi:hypothetical protein